MPNQHRARLRASTAALVVALLLPALTLTTGTGAATAFPRAQTPAAQVALHSGMRTLWDQHMAWTWSTVVAFATSPNSLKPTLNRLLQNQTELGNAIKPYYGNAAGNKLSKLLHTHILDAVPVLKAAKAGDRPALKKAVTAWYGNAKDIADFLAAANPNWPKAQMGVMMKTHITQTIAYASDVLAGHWNAAIAKFNEAQRHMDQMADMLTEGIVAQFPAKF